MLPNEHDWGCVRQVGVWVGKVFVQVDRFSGSEPWLLHTDTQLCSVLSLPSKEELLLPPVPPHPQPEETLPTLLPAFPQGPPCPPEIPPKPPRLLPEFGECHRTAGLCLGALQGSVLVTSSPLGEAQIACSLSPPCLLLAKYEQG